MHIDVVCLGVGKGISYIVKGQPSTSFVLRVDKRPKLLVDCGLGTYQSYQQHIGPTLPEMIYISHNHTDHTGELPGLLALQPNILQILGHPDVLEIVKVHRLHELASNSGVDDIAIWRTADVQGGIDLGADLSLHLFRSIHQYLCYGFILQKHGLPLLGYSGDTAFDEDIYRKITKAPVAIVDGRDYGNHDHASLEDINTFAPKAPQCSIWTVHYEETDYVFTAPNAHLWHVGAVIELST